MYNSSAAGLANGTLDSGVLGLSFDPNLPITSFVTYNLLNVIICAVLPIPLASSMVAVAVVLYGMVLGLLINTVSTVIGCWLSLIIVRHMCRPRVIRLLGRYEEKWQALDFAIVEEGFQIALLIRLAPVAPLVLSNVLLSMTSISQRTYLWTTAVGIVPSNLPFAYVALVGKSMLHEFPPRDPLILSLSLLGLLASVLIAWKIGRIATRVLNRHGIDGSSIPRVASQIDGIDGAAAAYATSDCPSDPRGEQIHSEPTSPRIPVTDGRDAEGGAAGGGGSGGGGGGGGGGRAHAKRDITRTTLLGSVPLSDSLSTAAEHVDETELVQRIGGRTEPAR